MQPKLILVDDKKRDSYLEAITANFVLFHQAPYPSVLCYRMKKVLQFEFSENNMVYTFFCKKSQSFFLTIDMVHKHVTFSITHVCYSV